MIYSKPTVFFGPFFGELGWELSHWHGWVKKMCRGKYKNFRKIAASYPGREPFYPDADEFWAHPPEISGLKISQRNYIADFWTKDAPADLRDVSGKVGERAEQLLKKYRENLPPDTVFFVPHRLNVYDFEGKKNVFGVFFSFKNLDSYEAIKVLAIEFEHQIFEKLKPTEAGKKFLRRLVNPKRRLIAVFPRHRLRRAPQKNWPKEKYDLLIARLQKKYPSRLIALFGAPGGSYYLKEKPKNCLDLINIDDNLRFNVQLAALEQADLALGSISGALLVALLAGVKVVEWGHIEAKQRTLKNNFLKTPLIYWPELNPSVEKVEELVALSLQGRENEIVYPANIKRSSMPAEKKSYPALAKDFFIVFWKEIASRIVLARCKNKNLKEGII